MKRRTCIAAAFVVFLVVGASSAASAQGTVEGAADFRTAPRITDGIYTDRIVSGESVWYAVYYTSDTPFVFTAHLRDEPPKDTSFSIELVGRTLETLGSPKDSTLEGSITLNDEKTATLYIKVNLATTGEVGKPYDFELDVRGATAGRNESCDTLPDCHARDDAEQAKAELDQAQQDLAHARSDPEDVAQQQIARKQQTVDELEDELAPTATTPVLLVGLLVLVGVVGAVGGFLLSRRRSGNASQRPPPEEPATSADAVPPSAGEETGTVGSGTTAGTTR